MCRQRSHNAPWFVLAALTTLLLTAPSCTLASASCPNEAIRAESRVNPTTGQPYDMGLPECRAYEVVVTTLEKGLYDVEPVAAKGAPVAPAGDAVAFASISAFAGVENVSGGNSGQVVDYVSHRTRSGWAAEGEYPPASLIANPFSILPGFSPDLSPLHLSCGYALTDNSAETPVGVRCALGRQNGSWVPTPTYPYIGGTSSSENRLQGSSADLSRAVIQAGNFLPADTAGAGGGGLYEIAGVGTASPELRLVSVDNSGTQLATPEGSTRYGPSFGDSGHGHTGTAYQAMSESGETVFFTATPTATQQPAGERQTVYARVHHIETVPVSNPVPAECTTCSPTPAPATYQGSSADGSKVFFTTAQQLVNGDKDETNDLYMYDFANPPTHHLVQLSGGGLGDATPGVGAEVQGVLRTSSDGSHVYLVATGVLTSLPNSLGQLPQLGADNLYGVDTNTGETKFVATLSGSDGALWGEEDGTFTGSARDAQTTLDGRYLVFSTFAHLVAEDTNNGQAAYRYDFQTGELTWLSHPAVGFTALDEGANAVIAPIPGNEYGGHRDINDWSRALTGNGEDVIFWTSEKLQANDTNKAGDVYLWHSGAVSLISDGRDPLGTATTITSTPTSEPWAGISESGSDIFFFTHTQLVGQHTDVYQALYDARIGGGFPAPQAPTSCSAEEWTCQGKGSEAPGPSKLEGSSTQEAGGNLTAAPFKELLEPEPKPKSKPLTNAQKLARALRACRKKPRRERSKCDARARKRYHVAGRLRR
jgi:hypothetical protein